MLALTKQISPQIGLAVTANRKPTAGLGVLSVRLRAALASLAALILSACAEPSAIESKSTKISTTKSENSITYGRRVSFSYPDFSGDYPVASHSMLLTDYGRAETFKPNSLERRKLQVRFFYPTDESAIELSQKKLPVINPISWKYLVGHQQIEGKRLRYANYQNAVWDVTLDSPVNSERQNFPILVFSHGYGYNTESYTALLAELASKGYLIVAINHSYGANPSDLGIQGEQDSQFSATLQSSQQPDRFIWAEELKHHAIEQYLPIWSDDQVFVIEQLARLNSEMDSMFYQKLDLSNVGLFGHSYGGAAAYHTAARDSRVKAIMDIDGTIFNYDKNTIVQPFAFLVSDQHQPKFDFNDATASKYLVRLNRFSHATFTDHILWWQWDYDEPISELGEVESLRAIELTSELVDDFFAGHLLQQPSQWFNQQDITTNEFSVSLK